MITSLSFQKNIEEFFKMDKNWLAREHKRFESTTSLAIGWRMDGTSKVKKW